MEDEPSNPDQEPDDEPAALGLPGLEVTYRTDADGRTTVRLYGDLTVVITEQIGKHGPEFHGAGLTKPQGDLKTALMFALRNHVSRAVSAEWDRQHPKASMGSVTSNRGRTNLAEQIAAATTAAVQAAQRQEQARIAEMTQQQNETQAMIAHLLQRIEAIAATTDDAPPPTETKRAGRSPSPTG